MLKKEIPILSSQKIQNQKLSELDRLVKSLLGRHPGESRGPERLEITGFRRLPRTRSGVRRNDEFYGISTFYEIIKHECFKFRYSVVEFMVLCVLCVSVVKK